MRSSNLTVGDDISAVTGIVAKAAGTQATATQLTAGVNRIATCATAADSVKLPAAKAGMYVYVANDGAASCQVYGYGTDTIDAVATATGKALANGKRGLYVCHVDGAWTLLLGA